LSALIVPGAEGLIIHSVRAITIESAGRADGCARAANRYNHHWRNDPWLHRM